MLLRQILILTVAAALGAGAAMAAPAAKGHKPAASGARAADADLRDPDTLIAILDGLGAKATVGKREADAVFLTVTSPTENFSAQFAGCDPQGKRCQAVLFDRPGATGAPTLAQINAFNQTSVMCRLYQDKAGRAHVEYSTLLLPSDGRAGMLMQLNAWRGCLADFAAFLKDPPGFLANAP